MITVNIAIFIPVKVTSRLNDFLKTGTVSASNNPESFTK
jgi:hypothetical protein